MILTMNTQFKLTGRMAAFALAATTTLAMSASQGFTQGVAAHADEHKAGDHHETGAVGGEAHTHDPADMAPDFAVAVLRPTKDSKVRGQLRLVATGERVRIMGKVNNLTPGKHGFHIHEFGDARARDGKSAGGHYNPSGHDHGAPGEMSHAGDLGNITAGENGVAEIDVTITDMPLHFLFGRSFVVHAGEDDLKSQPSGDAGGRVAVGIIGVGNKEFSMKGGN